MASCPVPDHIAPARVRDFDLFSDPRMQRCPFDAMGELARDHEQPFFTPNHYMLPGSWILTRAADIRFVYGNPDLFSSSGNINFSALIGEAWQLIPLELDPPVHAAYRRALTPILSGAAIESFDAGIRNVALDLIRDIAPHGACEFVTSFGRVYPVAVFLRILGLPQDRLSEFVGWTVDLLSSFKRDRIRGAARSISDCLRAEIAGRRRYPKDDILSKLVKIDVEGRAVSDDEALGMAFLLFIAGLKTVASSLGFHFHHLATHPEDQLLLRNERGRIAHAVDELVRLYSISNNHRRAVRDVEIGGVMIGAGDWITLPTMNGSRDPDEFPDPGLFDLDRKSRRHLGFGFGVHHCLGAPLARREFAIALETWFDHVPFFRLKPSTAIRTTGGGTFGVEELHLEWS